MKTKMFAFLKKIKWKTLFLNEEKVKELSKSTNMWNTMKAAEKVFVAPEMEVTVEKYKGPNPSIVIFGIPVKLPMIFSYSEWANDVGYWRRLNELHIERLPAAYFVRLGKLWTCKFKFKPINDTSTEKNYWTSVIEYVSGQGTYKGNLHQLVQYLGKESLGLPFNEDDWDRVNNGWKGNSLYFVVDRSFIQPEYRSMYDFACKEYNKNESTLMI